MTQPALARMLCFDTYAANLAFGRVYKPLLDPLRLTYPQYLVLLALWQQDGMTVGEIGAELGLASSTLTPLIKRLETAGLLTRARDTEDERRVHVSLSASGRALESRAAHIPGCVAQATGLSRDEFQALHDSLVRLRCALDANLPATA